MEEYERSNATFENDIDINLKALIRLTEKYGVQDKIRAILTIGSASAHTGSELCGLSQVCTYLAGFLFPEVTKTQQRRNAEVFTCLIV